jgi:hypothetical protein
MQPTQSFPVGARVLGLWTANDFWYPGRIAEPSSEGFRVKFDHDDDIYQLTGEQVIKAENLVGRSVFRTRQHGKLLVRKEDFVRLQLDTGEPPVEATLDEIFVSDEEMGTPAVECTSLAAGTRVLGRWWNGYWYPGRIAEKANDRFLVKFDDGDESRSVREELTSPDSAVGRGVYYVPRLKFGKILMQEGEALCLELEGESDRRLWTMLSSIRLPSEGIKVATTAARRWQVGDRALARWPVELLWWYPGTIRAIEGERFDIQFDDGDSARVKSADLAPLAVEAGSRVFGRLNQGRLYFPGKVREKDGDRIYIRYDDGKEEWTTISMVRSPRI